MSSKQKQQQWTLLPWLEWHVAGQSVSSLASVRSCVGQHLTTVTTFSVPASRTHGSPFMQPLLASLDLAWRAIGRERKGHHI
mmetsp:Transcript_57707/g.187464  ORF Transcript_57707/g.187464 Transcript_57707/m.187464 type:complete len:82 (-) Transcript_57707:42-287(-)